MGKYAKSKYSQKAVIVIATAAATLICLAAWASAEAPKQGRGPCAEDIAKYCMDMQTAGGWIVECLNEHENDLSMACKERIARVKQRSSEILEACKEDSQMLCRDVQPGHGRLMRCLKEHETALSPACKEKLPKGRRGK